jgi:GTP diphosphokinase / guanosine-3',5'-bis(diphosphate) 3'-diphosphatase
MHFKDLVKKILRNNKDADLELIEKSFLFIYRAYEGESRVSGEPMIEHNLQVARILSDLKADDKTIAAGMLHDVLAHNKISKKELCHEFGEEICTLVEGETSLSTIKKGMSKDDIDAVNLRKLLLATAKDVRVIFIKLADRLHNIRTVGCLSKEKRLKAAKEAIEIYAPIAYRLGISSIKRELEDTAFSYLEPEEYERIKNFVEKERKNQEIIMRKTLKIVEKIMSDNNIQGDVQWRVKHIYSIYKKIVDKNCLLENMRDIAGIRVITNDNEGCYRLLQLIHEEWKPVQGTFKDYIAAPKPNGYQSLHTVVIAIDGKPLEFQIRTKEMHNVAEEGVAAHFGYKGVKHGDDFDKKLIWLKELVEEKSANSAEFLEHAKIDFFSEKIYVFTPKGKLIELPTGAMPLDFAYAIHSGLGDTTIGANVNGKYVSLKTELKNGDIAEIITSKNQKPSREWLKMVKTYKAKGKIRQYLKQHGQIVTKNIAEQTENAEEITKEFISVIGIKGPEIKLSLCCNPLPGDKITGYKTGYRKVMVHRNNCPVIDKNKGKNIIKVLWKDKFDSEVCVFVDGVDRLGFFAEILNTVASRGYEVNDTKGRSLKNGNAEVIFRLRLTSIKQLYDIISRLKRINGVVKVYVETIKEKKKK